MGADHSKLEKELEANNLIIAERKIDPRQGDVHLFREKGHDQLYIFK